MNKPIFFLFLAFILSACQSSHINEQKVVSRLFTPALSQQPNIVWIVAEDLGPYIPSFGDSTIETPNLSRLAAEGICFDNFYSPSPVCAPSRSALATGCTPTQIGSNHMRTGPWYVSDLPPAYQAAIDKQIAEGARFYEAVPRPEIKMFSEFLRKKGYYCANNAKEDYQFKKTVTAWDESSRTAHWRNRKEGQPFFYMTSLEVTHESRIWQKANDSLWVKEDLSPPVPPYLPDTEVGRRDIRRMYSNIKEMDHQVGELLAQLEEDGVLDNTIIIWFTDHGGPLPRQKRLLYDSGLKVPMIVRFPNKEYAGTRDDRLVSFIDLPPTTMALAGLNPPDYMNGQVFLGEKTAPDRDYIFAAADRFDETTDTDRAVRDKRFKYIRHYKPEKPMFLHVKYRDQMAIMQELYRLKEEGKLTEAQALWFQETKPEEELFDTREDPHEIFNLVGDPAYRKKLEELREASLDWIAATDDRNIIPEDSLLAEIWPEGKQPMTAAPQINLTNGKISLSCPTPGASLGFKFIGEGEEPGTKDWLVYTQPFEGGAWQAIVGAGPQDWLQAQQGKPGNPISIPSYGLAGRSQKRYVKPDNSYLNKIGLVLYFFRD